VRPGRLPEDDPKEQEARRRLRPRRARGVTVSPGPQVSQTNGGATEAISKATFRKKSL
jgi:hypothetical protein